MAYKKCRGNKGPFSFKIISVGNLTVGGTGKSVVVPYILDILGKSQTAIVMRGYGGSIAKTSYSKLVTDGDSLYVNKNECGDEAMMYALNHHVPVVVGKNRAQSCTLVESYKVSSGKQIDYVVLDDGYQNVDVKKNCELLLLDARAPFDNDHCLPAGWLREKDYTRAHAIIMTHADKTNEMQRRALIKKLSKIPEQNIFFGAHVPAGIFLNNKIPISLHDRLHYNFFLFAGVGSFSGVCQTATTAAVRITKKKQFSDHQVYSTYELQQLFDDAECAQCHALLTTEKDWVKIEPLLELCKQTVPLYVIRVRFEFLRSDDYDKFVCLLHKYMK